MEIDSVKVFGRIKQELVSDRPLSASMNRVVDACNDSYPHEDWSYFRNLEYDNWESLHQWMDEIFHDHPPPANLAGLWFGLFNPIYGDDPTADVNISGSSRFDPDPDDNSWAVESVWPPINRPAHSSILSEIYTTAYRPNGLGNDAEWSLCLAYGCLVIRILIQSGTPSHFLGSSPSLGVAVGFNSGDFILLGQLAMTGFILTE